MKNSLLILLLTLLLTNCSQLQPRIGQRLPASDDCKALIARLLEKRQLALEIPESSLFGTHPNLYKKMDAIQLPPIDHYDFYQEFLAVNKRPPTVRDAFEYSRKIKSQVLQNYEDLIKELRELPNNNSEINNFIHDLEFSKNKLANYKSAEQINLELVASYKNGKTSIMGLDTVMKLDPNNPQRLGIDEFNFLKNISSTANFQGEYGELLAHGAATEKVLMRGLMFRSQENVTNPLETMIIERVSHLQSRLNRMSNEELLAFITPHKDDLFRIAYQSLADENFSMASKDIAIEKMMTMIRSKEIDLVTETAPGKMIWAEVKAYNRPISVEVIAGHGDKTILIQLKEHKALRDVLGFKNTVKLRFISPLSTIDDEARKLIEALGYEVISAK